MRLVPLRPQPPAVRLDDRTADREPHAHPLLFRREERLEQLVRTRDARAAIADLGLDHIAYPAYAYSENPVTRGGDHCVCGVAHQVDQDLLNLDAVERDERKIVWYIDVHANAAPCCLLGHEVVGFGNDAGERRSLS